MSNSDQNLPSKLNWDVIRFAGNSSAIQSSYFWLFFVPVIAKALSSLSSPLTFKIHDQLINLHIELPFSWTLFYFAALCFAIATLIYLLRCPNLIRSYSSFLDYKHAGRGMLHLFHQLVELQHTDGGKFKDEIVTAVTKGTFSRWLSVRHDAALCTTEDPTEDDLGTLFWFIRDRQGNTRKIELVVATILYLAGGVLITLVIAQNLRFVLNHVLR